LKKKIICSKTPSRKAENNKKKSKTKLRRRFYFYTYDIQRKGVPTFITFLAYFLENCPFSPLFPYLKHLPSKLQKKEAQKAK